MSKEKIFRRRIIEALRDPRVTWCPARKQYTITGYLDLKTTYAEIVVILPRPLKKIRRKPPEVFCRESWVKRDVDWHVYRDAALCWIIDPIWDEINWWPHKPRKLIAEDCAAMLLESVNLLLSRHLWASKKGITKWDKRWDQWSHGQEGLDECENEQNFRRFRKQSRRCRR